jgi:hypothetical protein
MLLRLLQVALNGLLHSLGLLRAHHDRPCCSRAAHDRDAKSGSPMSQVVLRCYDRTRTAIGRMKLLATARAGGYGYVTKERSQCP